jgi:hypothetical protein
MVALLIEFQLMPQVLIFCQQFLIGFGHGLSQAQQHKNLILIVHQLYQKGMKEKRKVFNVGRRGRCGLGLVALTRCKRLVWF